MIAHALGAAFTKMWHMIGNATEVEQMMYGKNCFVTLKDGLTL